jgi:hypothetical protein
MDGNAYWRKIRNSIGDVLGYWYLPHWLVSPQRPPGMSTIFTSHYRYTPVAGGVPEDIPPRHRPLSGLGWIRKTRRRACRR